MKKLFLFLPLLLLAIISQAQLPPNTVQVTNRRLCTYQYLLVGTQTGTTGCGNFRTRVITIAPGVTHTYNVSTAPWGSVPPPTQVDWQGINIYSDFINCPPTGSMTNGCANDQGVNWICAGSTCMWDNCTACGGQVNPPAITILGAGSLIININ